jgi:hypothetical protein
MEEEDILLLIRLPAHCVLLLLSFLDLFVRFFHANDIAIDPPVKDHNQIAWF